MTDGVLSRSWYSYLKHRNRVEQLLCFRCGGEIHVGDSVHTNSGNGRTAIKPLTEKKVRVYHSECFEQMFIEC